MEIEMRTNVKAENLTGILATLFVSRTHLTANVIMTNHIIWHIQKQECYHLVVHCELDASCPVPGLTVPRVYDGNLNCLLICAISRWLKFKESTPGESLVDRWSPDPLPPSQRPRHVVQLNEIQSFTNIQNMVAYQMIRFTNNLIMNHWYCELFKWQTSK